MSDAIFSALQATSEDIARARRAFNRDKRASKRDSLICAMSYGIQMCLRAQSMRFRASAGEAGTAADSEAGVAEGEHATAEGGDAQTTTTGPGRQRASDNPSRGD